MRHILHIDLNNFFASVACLYDSSLNDAPMVVGGDASKRHGIVLAKNEKAKALKIQTAETLYSARQKCPDLVIVPPDYPSYLHYSRMAREIYERYSDQIEPFGLDEVWMDVTESGIFGDSHSIADEIRATLKGELGLTASVGDSYNKIFAKLGSDIKKPDATTSITPENFRSIVWPLPASDLLFVGKATAAKLQKIGVEKIGDIARCDPDILRRQLGKWGEMLYIYANGEDDAPVKCAGEESVVKSIGNSTTTPRDLVNQNDVKLTLFMLAESVAARLRKQGFRARTLQISVRNTDLEIFQHQGKLSPASDLTDDIAKRAFALFCEFYHWEKPIRSVGIAACDLELANSAQQLSLLFDMERHQRQRKLEESIDVLRNRYGPHAVRRGMMMLDDGLTLRSPKDEHVEPSYQYNRKN